MRIAYSKRNSVGRLTLKYNKYSNTQSNTQSNRRYVKQGT